MKISEEDSKYLKFYSGKFFWNLLCYQIDCLQVHDRWQSPYLGIVGVIVATDDIIVLGENYKEYIIGTIKTIKLFLKLGFIIHPEKRSWKPLQQITYLGFVFNPKEMLVTLNQWKNGKVSWVLQKLFKDRQFHEKRIVQPYWNFNINLCWKFITVRPWDWKK